VLKNVRGGGGIKKYQKVSKKVLIKRRTYEKQEVDRAEGVAK
jgi:hypothetical protein